MYIRHHVRYPLFFSDFNETWIFSKGFRKDLKFLWKSVSIPCGRKDMTKIIVAFCNFANAPKTVRLTGIMHRVNIIQCIVLTQTFHFTHLCSKLSGSGGATAKCHKASLSRRSPLLRAIISGRNYNRTYRSVRCLLYIGLSVAAWNYFSQGI